MVVLQSQVSSHYLITLLYEQASIRSTSSITHSFAYFVNKKNLRSWTENKRSFNLWGSLASSKNPSKSYFQREKSSAKSLLLLSSHSPLSSLLTSKCPSSFSSKSQTMNKPWIIPKRTLPTTQIFLIASPPNGLLFGSSKQPDRKSTRLNSSHVD